MRATFAHLTFMTGRVVPCSCGTFMVVVTAATRTQAGRDDLSVIQGEVTLQPCADGRPGYEPCGQSADAWVSRGILGLLDQEVADLPGGLADGLTALAAVASETIKAYLTNTSV